MRLSLAGRAMVVNQKLLASAWYVASCWCFSRACIKKLRRVIRNFLGLDLTVIETRELGFHGTVISGLGMRVV